MGILEVDKPSADRRGGGDADRVARADETRKTLGVCGAAGEAARLDRVAHVGGARDRDRGVAGARDARPDKGVGCVGAGRARAGRKLAVDAADREDVRAPWVAGLEVDRVDHAVPAVGEGAVESADVWQDVRVCGAQIALFLSLPDDAVATRGCGAVWETGVGVDGVPIVALFWRARVVPMNAVKTSSGHARVETCVVVVHISIITLFHSQADCAVSTHGQRACVGAPVAIIAVPIITLLHPCPHNPVATHGQLACIGASVGVDKVPIVASFPKADRPVWASHVACRLAVGRWNGTPRGKLYPNHLHAPCRPRRRTRRPRRNHCCFNRPVCLASRQQVCRTTRSRLYRD